MGVGEKKQWLICTPLFGVSIHKNIPSFEREKEHSGESEQESERKTQKRLETEERREGKKKERDMDR